MGKVDTLLDVALETFYTGLEENLLLLVDFAEWVGGLLGSGCLEVCQ